MEVGYHRRRFETTVFDTLYLGGGTPSLLEVGDSERLFNLLRENFRFKNGAEVTLEANPGDVDARKAALYKKLGVTRVSLGAQSFNDATLEAINRTHRAQDTLRSFNVLREAGFANLSLDLMLALPGEDLDAVGKSVTELLRLGPEHVSVYELTVEEKTVFGRLSREGKLRLPDETLQTQMLGFTRRTLKEAGYRHYELLNYARPGFESRHNLLYWANAEYLGLGPGAFSYFGGRRFRYSADVDGYFSKIKEGDWSAHETETLTPEKKEVESLLLALRLIEGADAARFKSLMQRSAGRIEDLKAKGLLETVGARLRLSERGQFLAETVFAELS